MGMKKFEFEFEEEREDDDKRKKQESVSQLCSHFERERHGGYDMCTLCL
jgi:hypothetical protein